MHNKQDNYLEVLFIEIALLVILFGFLCMSFLNIIN